MNLSSIPILDAPSQEAFAVQFHDLLDETSEGLLTVSDGTFAVPHGWQDVGGLTKITGPMGLVLHLAVHDPRRVLAEWHRERRITRAYIHAEAHYAPVERGERNNLFDAMPTFFAYGFEIGIALMPETSVTVLEPLMQHLYHVLLVSSDTDTALPARIRAIREKHPTVEIGVRGLTQSAALDMAAAAGANRLYVRNI